MKKPQKLDTEDVESDDLKEEIGNIENNVADEKAVEDAVEETINEKT